MIPVYQTRTVLNDGKGNCFNACVASILELPLRDVCQVLPGDADYWDHWEKWLEPRGLELNNRNLEDVPVGFAIATGYGGRVFPEGHRQAGQEILHAVVVFNGKPVHDPFPNAEAFDRIRYWWTIDPVADEQAEAA